MPQLLPTAQYPHGSERLPLCPYASSRLQSSTGRQIHLMREERTCLLSEKRGTPGQSSGKNDPLQEVPTLRPQQELTPKLLRPPRLAAKDERHLRASLRL